MSAVMHPAAGLVLRVGSPRRRKPASQARSSDRAVFSEGTAYAYFSGGLAGMHLVTSPEAARLAGLSTLRLREWTRRGLFTPDILPSAPGADAGYSWQTILLLRVAVILRDRFSVVLERHRYQFFELAAVLSGTSFNSLWGKSLALNGHEHWSLVDLKQANAVQADCIVFILDSHLHLLSAGFALPKPAIFGRFTTSSPAHKAAEKE